MPKCCSVLTRAQQPRADRVFERRGLRTDQNMNTLYLVQALVDASLDTLNQLERTSVATLRHNNRI